VVKATIRNFPLEAPTTSNALRPMLPVEPSTAMRFGGIIMVFIGAEIIWGFCRTYTRFNSYNISSLR
jgi:hypothetical protein